MKMKPEHYDKLKAGINDSLELEVGARWNEYSAACAARGFTPMTPPVAMYLVRYAARDLSPKRARWDLLWSWPALHRNRWFGEAYTYLNDDHIDTALRRIIKELGEEKSSQMLRRVMVTEKEGDLS